MHPSTIYYTMYVCDSLAAIAVNMFINTITIISALSGSLLMCIMVISYIIMSIVDSLPTSVGSQLESTNFM